MRNSYGYSAYRGRSGAKTVLTVVAVVLLILLLLLVGFFFFAQRYVVYYDDGSVHFEFPWTTQAEATPTPVPTPSQDLVVVTTEPSATPSPAPAGLPVLVELPLSSLTEGTAQAEVTAAGGSAALFTLKNEKGHLAYASSQPWAQYAQVTETDPAVNEAITSALAGDELYAVAKICCFKDDDTPYYYGRSNGLRTGNGNWRDETGSRWFSPAAQGARDYIIGICQEVAALGFDELWLDYCFFPAAGRLANIVRNDAYNDATLEDDLEEFCRQLRDALDADHPGLKVSLTVSPALFSEEANPSGQTWELLSTYADRIYFTSPPEQAEDPAALSSVSSAIVLPFAPGDIIYFGSEDPLADVGRVITPQVKCLLLHKQIFGQRVPFIRCVSPQNVI